MALRQIIPVTDKLLREPSVPVELIDGEVPTAVLDLAGDMLETTRMVGGAGMAAVQVGEPIRMFVMDLASIKGDTLVFINPEITQRSVETIEMLEGCLSMPGLGFPVERNATVTVRYTTIDGVEKTYDAAGYAAVCCQHEIDHLDGIRNIDRLSPLKRNSLLTRFKKLRART